MNWVQVCRMVVSTFCGAVVLVVGSVQRVAGGFTLRRTLLRMCCTLHMSAGMSAACSRPVAVPAWLVTRRMRLSIAEVLDALICVRYIHLVPTYSACSCAM